jgi:hypothetical protein
MTKEQRIAIFGDINEDPLGTSRRNKVQGKEGAPTSKGKVTKKELPSRIKKDDFDGLKGFIEL